MTSSCPRVSDLSLQSFSLSASSPLVISSSFIASSLFISNYSQTYFLQTLDWDRTSGLSFLSVKEVGRTPASEESGSMQRDQQHVSLRQTGQNLPVPPLLTMGCLFILSFTGSLQCWVLGYNNKPHSPCPCGTHSTPGRQLPKTITLTLQV